MTSISFMYKSQGTPLIVYYRDKEHHGGSICGCLYALGCIFVGEGRKLLKHMHGRELNQINVNVYIVLNFSCSRVHLELILMHRDRKRKRRRAEGS